MGKLQHHFIRIPAKRSGSESFQQLFEINRLVGFVCHIQEQLNLLLGSNIRILVTQAKVKLRQIVGHHYGLELLLRRGAGALEQSQLLKRILDDITKGIIDHAADAG